MRFQSYTEKNGLAFWVQMNLFALDLKDRICFYFRIKLCVLSIQEDYFYILRLIPGIAPNVWIVRVTAKISMHDYK